MHRRHLIALCGAILAVSSLGTAAALAASGAPTTVTLRVEGKTKTLFGPKRVQVPSSGWITRGGVPSGACPAASAQGVLDVATRHHWSGKWYASYSEYEIFTILGDKENGKHFYWEIFVNNVVASAGACDITLQPGDQLLFAVVPTKGPTVYPSALRGPGAVSQGSPFQVHVVGYNAAGRTKSLAHVRVTGGGFNVVTNSHGRATIDDSKTGRLVLRASPAGYVRAAPLVAQVRPFY